MGRGASPRTGGNAAAGWRDPEERAGLVVGGSQSLSVEKTNQGNTFSSNLEEAFPPLTEQVALGRCVRVHPPATLESVAVFGLSEKK